MFLRTYIPGPPLDECIDRFWFCSDTPSYPRERILPSGTVELVINLSDDEIRIYDPSHPDRTRRYGGATVSGPRYAPLAFGPYWRPRFDPLVCSVGQRPRLPPCLRNKALEQGTCSLARLVYPEASQGRTAAIAAP